MINKIFLCIALNSLSATKMPMQTASIQTACSHVGYLILQSQKNDLSPFILASLIWHESRWEHDAVSNKNACGLTQILTKYSSHSCEELKDPRTSIKEGVAALTYWKNHAKDMSTALKCYNSGYECSSNSYARIVLAKSEILKKEYYKQKIKLTEKLDE